MHLLLDYPIWYLRYAVIQEENTMVHSVCQASCKLIDTLSQWLNESYETINRIMYSTII